MEHTVSGHIISNGANAIQVDIGFIPDYVLIRNELNGTEAGLEWFRCIADAALAAAFSLYGIARGNTGTLSHAAAATNGIIPYNGVKTPRVRVPAPDGDGMVLGTVAGDWTYTQADECTARTAAVLGTIVRPTVHNGYVYECTVIGDGTVGLVEPTWGTVPGELTIDGDSDAVRWICREEDIVNEGGLGFEIGATLAGTADTVIAFKAERHVRSGDMGDAADGNPVTFK